MARFAEVGGAKTDEKCCRAAELALPVNLDTTVFLTARLTCSNLFQKAILADQVLWLVVIRSLSTLNLTVNKTTKVRLLAAVALKEGAAMVRKFLWLVVVDVTRRRKSFIVEDALLLCNP